ESGITKFQLSKLLRTGQLERARKGHYVPSGLPSPIRLAATHHATLTCASALRQHDVWAFEPDHPHFAIAAHDRRPRVNAVLHWRHEHDHELLVDSPLAALRQFRSCGSFEAVMAA